MWFGKAAESASASLIDVTFSGRRISVLILGSQRARLSPGQSYARLTFIRPSASREVILRLAVKDLVEQSQIAGAGQIEISFHEFGDVARRRRTEHPLRHSCASRAVPWRRSRRRLAAVG